MAIDKNYKFYWIFIWKILNELDNLKILILNSRDDEVIPFNQAEKLRIIKRV